MSTKRNNAAQGMVKRLMAMLVAAALVLTLLPASALAVSVSAAVVASGDCGENATWSLDGDGVLTISGSGEMEDYESKSSYPWYEYKASITEVVVGDGITTLGSRAFYNCDSLQYITLPDTLQSINDGACAGCASLQEIVFPDSLQSLGYSSFCDCSSLKELVIPDSVTVIGINAFARCYKLEKVTLPKNLKRIEQNTFSNCAALTSITIPDSVVYIDYSAFSYCTSLTDLQYPDTLTDIGNGTYVAMDIFQVEGDRNYEYAYEVLDTLNQEREAEGLDPLVMDERLLEAAMQRAAEISVYYSHTRPCGHSCLSVTDGSFNGENIAMGHTSPTAVMTGWMNSSGHKANILNEDYAIVGIGCFYSNGRYYWVQCFMIDRTVNESTESAAQPENCSVTADVIVDSELLDGYLGLDFPDLYSNASLDLGSSTEAKVKVTNPTYTSYSVYVEPDTFSWSSSDPSVATVDASGNVTALSLGTTTITAVSKTTGELSASGTLTVTAASLSNATVSLSGDSFTYTGSDITPAVTVTYGSNTLVQDTDYTVSYYYNINAGTAYALVYGCGNYTGTVTKAFTINKADQELSAAISSDSITAGGTASITASASGGLTYSSSDTSVATVSSKGVVTGVSAGTATITVKAAETSNYNAVQTTLAITVKTASTSTVGLSACTASLSASSYTYDGTAKQPAVTVKYGSTTLTQGTDYTVSYSNNINAGTATVAITGKGSYTGTVTKTFTINKASQSLTASISASSITAGNTASIAASAAAGAVTYSSSNTSVATVNSSGVVTGVSAGTATITVSAAATDNYYAAQTTISVTVTASGSSNTGSGNTGSGGTGSSDTGTGDEGSGDSGSSTGSATGDTLMVRRGNTCYFNYILKGGNADFSITAGRADDAVLVGDWDGDGVDTICLRRGNTCYFIDDITTMHVYLTVTYGRSTDEVLVGDWDGDGCDSLAMRRDGNIYYFCNDITDPNGDTWKASYGRAADEVLVGDWEDKGYDSLAVRRNGNVYYFSLSKVTDPNGSVWKTTFGRAGDEVLVGDWDANGTDTLAMRRNGNTYFISNSIADPNTGVDRFTFGRASDTVYAGKWK